MIVCLCEGVSDRDIKSVIHSGADCIKAVGQACGAGTGCGRCKSMVRQLLRESRPCASPICHERAEDTHTPLQPVY